jgi:hypothetical protein
MGGVLLLAGWSGSAGCRKVYTAFSLFPHLSIIPLAVLLICFAAFPVTSTRLRVPPTMLDIARPSDWAVFILYSFDPLRVRHGIPFGVRIGLNSGLLAMVRRSPLGETLGRDRMFFNLEQAVARYCREGRTTRDSHFKNSSTAGSPLSSE